MSDFLNSEDTHIVNHIQLENKVEQYSFGIAALNEIKIFVEEIKEKEKTFLDVRPFHIVYEMERIMKDRFYYIENLYKINAEKYNFFVGMLDEQIKQAQVMQMLALKYNKVPNNKYLERLIDNDEFVERQINLLECGIRLLDDIIE